MGLNEPRTDAEERALLAAFVGRDEIEEELGNGHVVTYKLRGRKWSPWWPLTRWEGSAHVAGTHHASGIRMIPVEFGMAGWTSCGATLPFRGWSRESVLEQMRRAVEQSAWAM